MYATDGETDRQTDKSNAYCPFPTLTFDHFDLETGVRVASKVENIPSKFGHARPLGSGVISYVRNGWTDRQTDKSNAYCSLPYGRRHNK